MQQPNGGSSPGNWYSRFGCVSIFVALIAGIATVIASGTFQEAIKPVLSGSSKCPISPDNLTIKIDNKDLKEGEKAYLSFEINDPKKLVSDLVFYGSWDSNFKAKIKPLNQKRQSVEYTAPTEENQVDRYVDTIRLTVADSTNEKCTLMKEARISIAKQTGVKDNTPVEFKLPDNRSSLNILPSPSSSSPFSQSLPPASSTPTSPIEPTKFVEQYYGLVNQSVSDYKLGAFKEAATNLESAYKMLSNPFKEALAPAPSSFQSYWNRCGLFLEKESIKLRNKSAEEATVSVILKQPRCQKRALYYINLNLNGAKTNWLIDSVRRAKYLE